MVDEQSMTTYGQSSIGTEIPVELNGLSYEEYFKKIEEMIRNLKQHWDTGQRVKALKIAIQLSKLLADTCQIKLYPKKFRMITDALDEFGQLIYNRIQSKANGEESQQQQSQKIHHLSKPNCDGNYIDNNREQAMETCRNWFFKIASIREAVPRFYAELTILKTCDFLLEYTALNNTKSTNQFYLKSLTRLTKATWGFGDPTVAIHARLYLCKVAERVINSSNDLVFELILMNVQESADLITRLDSISIVDKLRHRNVDLISFFELISNALVSVVNCISLRDDVYTDDDKLTEEARENLEIILGRLIDQVNKNQSFILARNIILNSTLRSIPPDVIAEHTNKLLNSIEITHHLWRKSQDDETNSLMVTIESFALALNASDSFELDCDPLTKTEILRTIDSILTDILKTGIINRGLTIGSHYLRCFTAWFTYANNHVELPTIDDLLNRFIAIMKKEQSYINHYSGLIDLVKIIISNKKTVDDFEKVFSMNSFLQLLEMLRKDDHKLEASKWILETMRANLKLNNRSETIVISNRPMINFIIKLFSYINDFISLLTATDDIEHLSQLIIYFLDKITILDYLDHLNFNARCRGSLANLNPVLEYLSSKTLQMALDFRKVEKRRNMRQNYLNGCLAFVFTTIPAINNPEKRLSLIIEGSRLALSQLSLSLADYYLKQALIDLNEQVRNFTSTFESRDTPPMQLVNGDKENGEMKFSKQLLEQVYSLLNLILNYEDHIDLKHKLILSNLIKDSFDKYPDLIKGLELLNNIDDNEDDIKDN